MTTRIVEILTELNEPDIDDDYIVQAAETIFEWLKENKDKVTGAAAKQVLQRILTSFGMAVATASMAVKAILYTSDLQ